MTVEVEERIHAALKSHPLERTEDGYRMVHAQGSGVSSLRLLPARLDGSTVVATAEITAQYNPVGLPAFHAAGVQRLNSMAVHGAYDLRNGQLHQTAQVAVRADEPRVHFVVQTILNAFGAQLPIGRSTALMIVSPEVQEQQRAHHAMPRDWTRAVNQADLEAATAALRERGLAAANDANRVWAELALSGDCPSRAIDPQAETALLQAHAGVVHPIAGTGYLATISLPYAEPPGDAAQLSARLNALEFEQVDFVPRLGAWGLHGAGDTPGYSCFIPSAEPQDGLALTMIWWCALRAAWLRDRVWTAKQGIVFKEHA